MYNIIKRLFDIILSLIGLIILVPFTIIIKVLFLLCRDKGKIMYNQKRIGKDGKPFNIHKYRTMVVNADEMLDELLKDEKYKEEWDLNQKIEDDPRITTVGKFLRKTSLDELPQLINVVKGDMALIGPRPLLTWFLPLYDETQMRRHEVRPGITGWAQVNGRNTVTYGEKFKYDVWYVDHLTMWLDIKILWMTVMNVLKRKDIGNGLQAVAAANMDFETAAALGHPFEVDDLGWNARKKEAIELFEKNFRNKQS